MRGDLMKTSMCRAAIPVLVALCLCACGKTPDEEQIAQNIAEMKEAVERKEFADIADHLHESFIANDRMNAMQVRRLLQMYGMQHRNIGATIISSKTTMDLVYTDRAESILSVVVTGSSGGLPSHQE